MAWERMRTHHTQLQPLPQHGLHSGVRGYPSADQELLTHMVLQSANKLLGVTYKTHVNVKYMSRADGLLYQNIPTI